MTANNEGIRAVVLSGGAAYGAYEVGVMKALFTGESPATGWRRLNAQIFSGTSIGSFNASVMSSQPGIDSAETARYLQRLWLTIVADDPAGCNNGMYRFRANPFNFFDPQCIAKHPLEPFIDLAEDTTFFAQDWLKRAMTFADSSGTLQRRLVGIVDLSTIISIDPYKATLKAAIDLEGVRTSEKVLIVATTNIGKGQLELFDNKDMLDDIGHRIVLASSAVPGFFPPVEIRGQVYLDGGITMNTPLRPAVRAGADILHVIYMDPDLSKIPLERLQNTLDVLDRVIVTTFASSMNRDIELATNINRGLEIIQGLKIGDRFSDKDPLCRAAGAPRERASTSLTELDIRVFIRVADQIRRRIQLGAPYKPLTIHRYHPSEDLGGILGMLNFGREKTLALIQRGYNDAVEHDCVESGCTLPSGAGPTEDWPATER